MLYQAFLYISCYIAELWTAFLTVCLPVSLRQLNDNLIEGEPQVQNLNSSVKIWKPV